jgi:hypothetical protein
MRMINAEWYNTQRNCSLDTEWSKNIVPGFSGEELRLFEAAESKGLTVSCIGPLVDIESPSGHVVVCGLKEFWYYHPADFHGGVFKNEKEVLDFLELQKYTEEDKRYWVDKDTVEEVYIISRESRSPHFTVKIQRTGEILMVGEGSPFSARLFGSKDEAIDNLTKRYKGIRDSSQEKLKTATEKYKEHCNAYELEFIP